MDVRELNGQTIGNYLLYELVGSGAMGAVYRARQTNLGRDVAVKILMAAENDNALKRFKHEAKLAASLEHPHIVPVYDFGTHQSYPYVSMRLLTGGTLAERMKDAPGPIPIKTVFRLLSQLGSALDYAHSRGVIHRDVKPSNIMFDERGSVYLVDFGIAKLANPDSPRLTATGMVVGTPTYMAPEQWQSDDVTPAADQYALAIVAYELLCGVPPFTGSNAVNVMMKHATDDVPHISRADMPDAMMPVLYRALEKAPEERFERVSAFAAAFGDAMNRHARTRRLRPSDKRQVFPQQHKTQQHKTQQQQTRAQPVPARPKAAAAPPSSLMAAPPVPQASPRPHSEPIPEQPENTFNPFAPLLLPFRLLWVTLKRLAAAILWLLMTIIKAAMRSLISIIISLLIMALLIVLQGVFFVALIESEMDFGAATQLTVERIVGFFTGGV